MESNDDDPGTMFVQVAGRVVFDGRSLTLLDLAPATVFVGGRPDDSFGYLPTGLFLDRWYEDGSGTRTRGVGAVLSFLDPDMAKSCDAHLALSLPRIRGTGMEYQARVLDGEVPSTAGACVLFISPTGTPTTPAHASAHPTQLDLPPPAA
jgi:hypothetical protein